MLKTMQRKMHISIALLALPLLLSTAPAHAAKGQSTITRAEQEAQEREARIACLNGDPAKGVAILSNLFVDTKNPTYIFNQARCFEQNARYSEAITRFEEYLRAEGKLRPEDKAVAEKHLIECQEKLDKERSVAPQPVAPPAFKPAESPSPGSGDSAGKVADPALGLKAAAPETPSSSRAGMLTAGIITGSVGVVALGTGILMAMKANGMVDDMETKVGGYSTDKNQSVKTYKTIAYLGYGVGAACLATGAILVGLGVRGKPEPEAGGSTNLAVLPALHPEMLGAVLTGGF